MNKIEIKARVDFRMRPLLVKGVRVAYSKSKFCIVEYDFFDNSNSYFIHVSDRVDPLEFDLQQIQTFLDDLTRLDHVPIPKFNDDATKLDVTHKPHQQKVHTKKMMVLADEDLEEEELPEELPPPGDDPGEEAPALPVKKGSSFVHIESMVKVYVTKDYGRFNIVKGNRPLNKMKIKRIIDDINAGTNLLKEVPILVAEKEGKLFVIEGQHRLEVCKQIQSYVWYIIREELSLLEIAKMNSNTEKWKGTDFINCYATNGNKHYQTLKEYMGTYDFPLGTSLQLLSKGKKIDNGGSEVMELFRQGRYQVKQEDEAISIAQEVGKFSTFKGHNTGSFIIAIARILTTGKVLIDDVVAAYEKNSEKLSLQKGWKDYIYNLETILNIGKKIRVTII